MKIVIVVSLGLLISAGAVLLLVVPRADAASDCISHPVSFGLCWQNSIAWNVSTQVWSGAAITETLFPPTTIDYIFVRSKGRFRCNSTWTTHWNNTSFGNDDTSVVSSGFHDYDLCLNGSEIRQESYHIWEDASEGIDEDAAVFNSKVFPEL